jgi:hypothetical protein
MNKLDVVFHVCNPSYVVGIGRRTVVQAGLDKSKILPEKITFKKV